MIRNLNLKLLLTIVRMSLVSVLLFKVASLKNYKKITCIFLFIFYTTFLFSHNKTNKITANSNTVHKTEEVNGVFTCQDGIQNGDETGIDCGGTICPPCNGNGACGSAAEFPIISTTLLCDPMGVEYSIYYQSGGVAGFQYTIDFDGHLGQFTLPTPLPNAGGHLVTIRFDLCSIYAVPGYTLDASIRGCSSTVLYSETLQTIECRLPIDLQSYAHKTHANEHLCAKELSGLTYNSDSDLLMAIGDAGMLLEWRTSKRVLNSESNAASCGTQNNEIKFYDTEAIVHIGDNEYAIMEESEAKVSFVTIDDATTMVDFPTNATYDLVNSSGTFPPCGGDGLEGLAYDKMNADFYTIKVAYTPELFTFKKPANLGTVLMTSITDLTTVIPGMSIESVHGLHFDICSGNLLMIGTLSGGNPGSEDNERVLVELTTAGAYVSHLRLEHDLATQFEPGSTNRIEGVTMIDDLIVLVGEGPTPSSCSRLYYLSKSPINKSPIYLPDYKHKILDNQNISIKELSGLTYNSDSDLFMAIGDEGMLLEWNKTERVRICDSNTANCTHPNSTTQFFDTEAIVHLACDKYAILEAHEAKLSIVTVDDASVNVGFPSNATYDLVSNLGTIPSCDDHGLEGLAYDQTNADFYTIKESGAPELFTFKIPATPGTVVMTSITDLTSILPIPSLLIESVHGIHFDDQSGNLLVIGTKSGGNPGSKDNDRILIELTTAGSYISHLDLKVDLPLQFGSSLSHFIEGVTMIGEVIVLIGEGPTKADDSKLYYLAKSDEIELDVKVFLEGCFYEPVGQMFPHLFYQEVLPGQANNPVTGQPYAAVPFNYPGTEGVNWAAYQNNMVDWVLVSFREEYNDKQFLSIAGIVQGDGQIIFPYNNPRVLNLSDFPFINSFYITIQHRNHLMIMSECTEINLGTLSIKQDFTIADSYPYNGTATGQKQVGSYYCMAAGDIDQSDPFGDINSKDKILWNLANGNFNAYSPEDVNMDADVNGGDLIMWVSNNGLFNFINKL